MTEDRTGYLPGQETQGRLRRFAERIKSVPDSLRARLARREQERQQQLEARALVTEIEKMFPEGTRGNEARFYTDEEYKRNKGILHTHPERARSYRIIPEGASGKILLRIEEPAHRNIRGNRNLSLAREYVNAEGIRARDSMSLTVLPNGAVQLDGGRRETEITKRQLEYVNSGNKFRDAVLGGEAQDVTRASFQKVPTQSPVDTLALGREIIGHASDAQKMQAVRSQIAAAK